MATNPTQTGWPSNVEDMVDAPTDDFGRAISPVFKATTDAIRANPLSVPAEGSRDLGEALTAAVAAGVGDYFFGTPGAGVGGILGSTTYPKLIKPVVTLVLDALFTSPRSSRRRRR